MKRRKVRIESVAEILDEGRRVLDGGYERVGRWSLGQVCEHLARMIEASMDGFSVGVPWWFRLGAPVARRMVLGWGVMPAGAPAPKAWVASEPVNDSAGLDRLRGAVARYVAWDQPLHASPALGRLTRAQWDRLHCVHAGHHFGFLVPRRTDG